MSFKNTFGDKHVTIPTLPSPWNNKVFTSTDIGGDLKGKHIDVYVGEGKLSEQEAYKITGKYNEVCY